MNSCSNLFVLFHYNQHFHQNGNIMCAQNPNLSAFLRYKTAKMINTVLNMRSFISDQYVSLHKDIFICMQTILCIISFTNLLKEQCNKYLSALCWVKNCLDSQAQRVVVNRVKRSHSPGLLQPILFNINDLYERIKCTLSKFSDNTTVGRNVNQFECWKALQKDPDVLDVWEEVSSTALNKAKCFILKFGHNNRINPSGLGRVA